MCAISCARRAVAELRRKDAAGRHARQILYAAGAQEMPAVDQQSPVVVEHLYDVGVAQTVAVRLHAVASIFSRNPTGPIVAPQITGSFGPKFLPVTAIS